MTRFGETTDFKASDFVEEIEKYLGGGVLDFVICNNKKPSKQLLDKYEKEKSNFVESDIKSNKKLRVIKTDLLGNIDLARHNPDKLAKTIMGIK